MSHRNKYTLFNEWCKLNRLASEDIVRLSHYDDYVKQSFLEAADVSSFLSQLNQLDRTCQIVVDTDYDCDGVMAGIILYESLKLFGFKPKLYYPNEKDGYGLTVKEAEHILQQFPETELIITGDNGINCKEAIDYLVGLNVNVLVTDHHLGDKALFPDKALACVNVNRQDKIDHYQFKHLSGAMTVYKLMELFCNRYINNSMVLNQIEALKPFAAISLLSDVMVIENENRKHVKELLDLFNNSRKLNSLSAISTPFKKLRKFVNHFDSDDITLDTFGYGVIPVINSARRMLGESQLAFELFDENNLISENATTTLLTVNELRKSTKKLDKQKADKNLMVNTDKLKLSIVDTRKGLLGLIASDYATQNKCMALVFNENEVDGYYEASGRGFDKLSIYAFLEMLKQRYPHIQFKFGGHANALGCSVRVVDFDAFCKACEMCVAEMPDLVDDESTDYVCVTFNDLLNGAFLEEVRALDNFVNAFRPLPPHVVDFKLRLVTTVGELRQRGLQFFGTNGEHAKLEQHQFSLLFFFNGKTLASIEPAKQIGIDFSVKQSDRIKLGFYANTIVIDD